MNNATRAWFLLLCVDDKGFSGLLDIGQMDRNPVPDVVADVLIVLAVPPIDLMWLGRHVWAYGCMELAEGRCRGTGVNESGGLR